MNSWCINTNNARTNSAGLYQRISSRHRLAKEEGCDSESSLSRLVSGSRRAGKKGLQTMAVPAYGSRSPARNPIISAQIADTATRPSEGAEASMFSNTTRPHSAGESPSDFANSDVGRLRLVGFLKICLASSRSDGMECQVTRG